MRKRQAGFTLLEVAVALAILVIGVTVVMQIFSGGFKNIRRIDLAHRAMSHGENVMNQILTDDEIAGPTTLSGDLDDDFNYTAEVTDWEAPDEGLSLDVAAPNVRLLKVAVEIHFKNDRFGKMYQLRCLKAVSEVDQNGVVQDPIQQLFQGNRR